MTKLTPAEQAAYELHIRGMSQHTIALALGIGRRTVRDRLENAHRKLLAASTAHGTIPASSNGEKPSTSPSPKSAENSSATKPKSSPASSKTTTPKTQQSATTETATSKPAPPSSEESQPSAAQWLEQFQAPAPTKSANPQGGYLTNKAANPHNP